jgi:hypothetical protein
MHIRIAAFACLGLCGIGCSGDEAEPRTREAFCRDWAIAACSEDVVDYCQARGPEECHQGQEDFCRGLVPEDFSDSEGAACIDAVKAAYADGELRDEELATVLKLGEPCDRLIVGPKAEGESCTEHDDCDRSAGFECVHKAGEASGSCQVPKPTGAGKDCEAAQATCEPGFYCDGENCIEANDIGEDCTIQEQCGDAAYCNDAGQCTERLAVSDACDEDVQCEEGICYEFEGARTCTSLLRLARSEPICDDLR